MDHRNQAWGCGGRWLQVPLTLAAMIDWGWTLIETAAVFLAIEVTVGQLVVEPLLFGSYTRHSSIGVVLCAAFWTFLWGPVPLILPRTLSQSSLPPPAGGARDGLMGLMRFQSADVAGAYIKAVNKDSSNARN